MDETPAPPKRLLRWSNAGSPDLTPAEHEAIANYRSRGYMYVNTLLHGGPEEYSRKYDSVQVSPGGVGPPKTPQVQQHLADLDSAMSKSALQRDTTLYRGVDGEDYPDSVWESGSVVPNDGFVSTSTAKNVAKQFATEYGSTKPVVVTIKAPAGTHAIKVDDREGEMLLDRGTSLRVTSSKMVGNVRHVEAEAVPRSAPDTPNEPPIGRLDRVKYGKRTGIVVAVNGDRLSVKHDGSGNVSTYNRSSLTRIGEPVTPAESPLRPEPADSPVWQRPNVTDLSEQDKTDMNAYAWDMESFFMINQSLRAQEPVPQEYAPLTERMTALIDRSALPADATLYRATFDAPDLVRQIQEAASTGQPFTEHGFMSTSLDIEKAREMDNGADPEDSIEFEIHIDAPKGTKALVYDGAILDRPGAYDQQEVLLQRGSQFRVDSMTQDDGGVWHAKMRLTAQTPPPPVEAKDYRSAAQRQRDDLMGVDSTSESREGWGLGPDVDANTAEPAPAPAATRLPSDTELPPAIGTAPIPPGTIRIYHYTDMDNAPSIERSGLLESRARGDSGLGAGNEPSAGVWAATGHPAGSKLEGPDSSSHQAIVEGWVRPDQISDRAESPWNSDPEEWAQGYHHILLKGDLPPEQIAAVHLPWHSATRYMQESKDPIGEYGWVRDKDPETYPEFDNYKKGLDWLERQQTPEVPTGEGGATPAPDLGMDDPNRASDWGREADDPREYAGVHQPSLDGPTLDDLQGPGKDGEVITPDDFYTRMDLYKYGGTEADDESEAAIKSVWGDPNAMVTIYRAAPPGVHTINRGDWITLSPTYAAQHAMQDDDPNHDWPVYKTRVSAKDVRWDGNDINEFGYDGVPAIVDENTDVRPVAQSVFDHSLKFGAQGGEVAPAIQYQYGNELEVEQQVEQARTEIEQMEDTMFGMRDEEGDFTNEVGLDEWENSDGVRFTRYALDVFDEYPEEDTRLWVARSDGQGVAGAMSLIGHPDYPDYMFIPYLGTTGIAEGTGSALLEQAIQHAAVEGKGLGGSPTSAALAFWRKHGWVSDPASEGWDFWGWTPEQVKTLAHGIQTAHPSESVGSQPSAPDSGSALVPASPDAQSLLRSQFPNVDIGITEKPDRLVLNRLVVPEGERGQGTGSQVMRALTDHADRQGKQIDLTPDTAFGGSSKSRLTRFYRQFGFKPNMGRSRDLTSNDTMIREPQTSTPTAPDEPDLGLDSEEPAGFTGPMTTDAPTKTWSGKINTMLSRAHQSGLSVEVEQKTEYGVDSIVATVRDPSDPVHGALFIYAIRTHGRAVAPRISGLRHYGGSTNPRKIANNADLIRVMHQMATDHQRRSGLEVTGLQRPEVAPPLPEATDNGGPWTVVYRKNRFGRFQKSGFGGSWNEAQQHAQQYPEGVEAWYVPKEDTHVDLGGGRKVSIEPTAAEKQAKRDEDARVKSAVEEILRPDGILESGKSYLERYLIGDARVLLGIDAPTVRAAAEALARAGWTRRDLGVRHS